MLFRNTDLGNINVKPSSNTHLYFLYTGPIRDIMLIKWYLGTDVSKQLFI